MAAVARRLRRHPVERGMTALWVVFTISYLLFFYVFQDAAEIADASLDGYLEVILLGVPSVILLGGRMWLIDSEADTDLRYRIIGWTVGMALFFALAVQTSMYIVEPRFDTGEQWLILLMSVGFGAASGTIMGILGIRSKQRERERNRSIREVKRIERDRSQLEQLNHYLRHEVLNETQKINGFATVLTERADLDGRAADQVDAIRHSSAEIATFVKSIRTILDESNHDPELTVVDLVAILEEEVEILYSTYRSVSVTIEGPESAPVLAGDILNRVFRNLFENAIEHNDGVVNITVSVERAGGSVTVRIRDDGSGIPVQERDRLFDPPRSGDHGYGLVLTANLVELYDGELELAETGPDGTEFVIRFPAETTAAESMAESAELQAAS